MTGMRARSDLGLLLILLSSCILGACSGDGTSEPQSTTLRGRVFKGSIVAADVSVYTVTSAGALNRRVAGPVSSDAEGAFEMEVPGGASGIHMIVAAGGHYEDEADGVQVDLEGRTLRSHVEFTGGDDWVTISPLTDIGVELTLASISAGAGLSDAFVHTVNGSEVGLGFDPIATDPLAMSQAGHSYAALLGGLSYLIADDPTLSALDADRADVLFALMSDLVDGELDGADIYGAGIMLPTGGGTAALPDLGGGLDIWLSQAATYSTLAGLDQAATGNVTLDVGVLLSDSEGLTITGYAAIPSDFTPTAFESHPAEAGEYWVYIAEIGNTLGASVLNDQVVYLQYIYQDDELNEVWFQVWNGEGGIAGLSVQGLDLVFDDVVLISDGGGSPDITINGRLQRP